MKVIWLHSPAAISLVYAQIEPASPPPPMYITCCEAWARVTIDQFRHLAMQAF